MSNSVQSTTTRRHLYKYRQLAFFARGGFVMLHDDRDGTVSTFDPVAALERSEALGLEAARCVFADEREEMSAGARDMASCAGEAAAQGNPLDPKVQEYHARHKHRNMVLVTGAPSPTQIAQRGGRLIVPGQAEGPAPKLIIPGGRR